MNNEKKEQSIRERRTEEQKKLLAALETYPVVQVACKRAGVSRGTFYRWRDEDADFAADVRTAMEEGKEFINDMSEAQLIELIKEKNFPPVRYWLSHHHPAYSDKLEITARIKEPDALTPEQEELVETALGLTAGKGRTTKLKK